MIRHFQRFFALVLALMMLLPAAQAQESAMNILLVGVDAIHKEENGRSDAMILIRADPAAGSIRMVSFLRDLYVDIPGHGRARLNAAWQHGGEALLKQALQEQFGVPVDRTVTVHFSLLAELVDQLGGVAVELSEREQKALNALLSDYGGSCAPVPAAGLQQLNGQQALCYSRIRKIDSDFQRTSRQQTLIAAMLKQASSLGRLELIGLAVRYLPRVQTDLTLGDVLTLLPLAAQLDSVALQTAQVPFEGAYRDQTVNGMMVLVPDLDRCRAMLRDFLN